MIVYLKYAFLKTFNSIDLLSLWKIHKTHPQGNLYDLSIKYIKVELLEIKIHIYYYIVIFLFVEIMWSITVSLKGLKYLKELVLFSYLLKFNCILFFLLTNSVESFKNARLMRSRDLLYVLAKSQNILSIFFITSYVSTVNSFNINKTLHAN